jgi:hypothetical protein
LETSGKYEIDHRRTRICWRKYEIFIGQVAAGGNMKLDIRGQG